MRDLDTVRQDSTHFDTPKEAAHTPKEGQAARCIAHTPKEGRCTVLPAAPCPRPPPAPFQLPLPAKSIIIRPS